VTRSQLLEYLGSVVVHERCGLFAPLFLVAVGCANNYYLAALFVRTRCRRCANWLAFLRVGGELRRPRAHPFRGEAGGQEGEAEVLLLLPPMAVVAQ